MDIYEKAFLIDAAPVRFARLIKNLEVKFSRYLLTDEIVYLDSLIDNLAKRLTHTERLEAKALETDRTYLYRAFCAEVESELF